jgi:Zn-dependent protease with chaperone function
MDFFEAQERAHRRTHRLIVLFVFAVLGTIAAGYFSALYLSGYARGASQQGRHTYYYNASDAGVTNWWDPKLFVGVTLGTLAVVGCASLYKWTVMRQGGAAIALSVGGRAIDSTTTDLHERRLLNVVEEMAIASGVPMPAVFVLDDEPGINAFAAGLTTADAAVTVTKGTLEKLTRDELQGVIGHEFSHILNGDMRLNVRVTAIIFGILVIGLLGRGLLWSMRYGRVRSDRKGGGMLLVVGAGLALLIIGYVGYFFGRLIQAAVSRQREFLADASSVQFTRNPGGITGALKKIGGYTLGSNVIGHDVSQLGHFFFAQGFRSNFGGAWATHPPLAERIRAIDPNWDGKVFEPPEVVDVSRESFAAAGLAGNIPPRAPAPAPFRPAQIVAGVGALTEAHFHQAQTLLGSIPASLREAARAPVSAQALVCGLLLDDDDSLRTRQKNLVEQHAGQEIAASLTGLQPDLSALDAAARLPLLQLSLPALRTLDGPALDLFATTLDELVHADGRVTPFEYALQKMLLGQLRLAQAPTRKMQFDSFDAVRTEISVVLSALARLGGEEQAATAFAAGAAQLPAIARELVLLESATSGLKQVDAALDKLAVSSLPIKKRLMVAAGHVISADGTITPEEGELFQALAATLDLPMPSLGAA